MLSPRLLPDDGITTLEHMFASPAQGSLFGLVPVSFDAGFSELKRVQLDDSAWLDYCPMWLSGDESLFADLVDLADWTQPVVRMYEREVLTPRLVASFEPDIHPSLPPMLD